MSKYKIAIFGAGKQVARLLKVIQNSKFEPAILFSRNIAKANHFLLEHQFNIPKLTEQITEALSDPQLKVVFIATPDSTHFEYALKSLRLKKHIFLEKPTSLHYKDALILLNEALKNKLILLIDYHLRCVKPIAYIKDLINTQYFGEITQINIDWHYAPNSISDWRNNENAWWCASMRGTHCLDLVLWLFGCDSIIEYTGTLDNSFYNKNDDRCILHLKLKNSILVTINCSLRKDQPLTLEIISKTGNFRFDHLVGEGQFLHLPDQKIVFEYENPWEKTVNKFYDLIETNNFPFEEVFSSIVNVYIFENLFKLFHKNAHHSISTQDEIPSLNALYATLRTFRSK